VWGIAANLANIVVLTRRKMVSPTNAILTWLAVADLLTMTISHISCRSLSIFPAGRDHSSKPAHHDHIPAVLLQYILPVGTTAANLLTMTIYLPFCFNISCRSGPQQQTCSP